MEKRESILTAQRSAPPCEMTAPRQSPALLSLPIFLYSSSHTISSKHLSSSANAGDHFSRSTIKPYTALTHMLRSLFTLLLFVSATLADDAPKPLRALMVTGGCCHDYENQKRILSEGISARANVEWTIVHEGGDTREHRVSIYEKPDWAKGYDVVLHNECFGSVNDVAFVEAIATAHKAGVPAVMLHCSSHSYRAVS